MAKHCRIIDGTIQINDVCEWVRKGLNKGLALGAVKISLELVDESDIDEVLRTDLQREKTHAMINDISKQAVFKTPCVTVKMSDYDIDEAKALLVRWFERECAQLGEPLRHGSRVVIDPFSGEKITIRPSTIKFLKKETINFTEWLYSTGADGGVVWSEKVKGYENHREAQQ